MIAAIYAFTMFAAVLVVLTPLFASAECAWVLWREDERKDPNRLAEATWAVPIAYADRAACVAVINDNVTRWEEKRSPTQSVERVSSGTAAEFRTRFDVDGWLSVRFRCLPDTVDPRGPKGGGRRSPPSTHASRRRGGRRS
jgi:hypothetical protein